MKIKIALTILYLLESIFLHYTTGELVFSIVWFFVGVVNIFLSYRGLSWLLASIAILISLARIPIQLEQIREKEFQSKLKTTLILPKSNKVKQEISCDKLKGWSLVACSNNLIELEKLELKKQKDISSQTKQSIEKAENSVSGWKIFSSIALNILLGCVIPFSIAIIEFSRKEKIGAAENTSLIEEKLSLEEKFILLYKKKLSREMIQTELGIDKNKYYRLGKKLNLFETKRENSEKKVRIKEVV